jgi:signal transduction histidine kinase
VLDATAGLRARSLISPAILARAVRGSTAFVDVPSVPRLDERARLFVLPAGTGANRLVLVVGATRENRAETLAALRRQLLLAGPIALVLATIAGYLIAGRALGAIESMRRRAEAIGVERPGERLPVPATGDELARLAVTLNEMLGRLQAGIERERAFVADASHELRTPLSLLRGELDLALAPGVGEEDLRESLRNISSDTDRLTQLTGDLLMLAGSEAGAVTLRVETVVVRDLVESVRIRFARRAADAGRPIEVDCPPQLTVIADRIRLEQALGNLVDNALRHGSGPVRLIAREVGGALELHVRDAGPGFDADFLPRAFERFARPEGARAEGGAGLGLAIVAAIAQAHDGTVAAGNNGGADVWLSLAAQRA